MIFINSYEFKFLMDKPFMMFTPSLACLAWPRYPSTGNTGNRGRVSNMIHSNWEKSLDFQDSFLKNPLTSFQFSVICGLMLCKGTSLERQSNGSRNVKLKVQGTLFFILWLFNVLGNHVSGRILQRGSDFSRYTISTFI